MPLDQNPHQTVTRYWSVGFSVYACGFSVPQMRQFCLFTYPPRSKLALSRKMIFFPKIGIFCKSIAGSLSEAKAHKMANWTQLLNPLGFICRHTKVFMQNSPQWRLPNVQLNDNELMLMALHAHFRNILGYAHCFWLFTLWFIHEDASFFHFFHKVTHIRSWRCFFSSKIRTQFSHTFCNIAMIFKVLSQYFPG